MKSFNIFMQISLQFGPEDPIDDQSALVQLVMVLCRIGDKPLLNLEQRSQSEPVLA